MKKILKTLLKTLFIYQEKEFLTPSNRIKKKHTKIRLNPYNPLTYLFIAIMFFIGLLKFGLVGIWKELYTRNPFKYQ